MISCTLCPSIQLVHNVSACLNKDVGPVQSLLTLWLDLWGSFWNSSTLLKNSPPAFFHCLVNTETFCVQMVIFKWNNCTLIDFDIQSYYISTLMYLEFDIENKSTCECCPYMRHCWYPGVCFFFSPSKITLYTKQVYAIAAIIYIYIYIYIYIKCN